MARLLGPLLRLPARGVGLIRRRPWTAVLVVGLLLIATGVGVWRYAVYQWGKAQVALREDRAEEAQQRLSICLRVWPRNPEVHLLAARAARLIPDLDAAEAHLNRVLQIQGGASEPVQLEFLLMRLQSGEVDEVAPLLLDAVDNRNPQSPIILETLARAYMIRHRSRPAYGLLTKWIELEPDNVKAYQWRAWVLERLNNHKGAMADYLKALELNPKLVSARLRVAEMLMDDKKTPEAVPHLELLVQQIPNDPVAKARLGACRFLQGRLEEARQLMEPASDLMPGDPGLTVAMANLDLQEGRGADAERRLRAYLQVEPADTEVLFVLASALRFQGKTAEADAVLTDYEKKKATVERVNDLLTNVADRPTAKTDDYVEIGRLFLEIGRDKLGLYYLNEVVEKNPTNQKAHRALAEYYERKGDREAAADHRRQLREPAAPAPASNKSP